MRYTVKHWDPEHSAFIVCPEGACKIVVRSCCDEHAIAGMDEHRRDEHGAN